MKGEPYRQLRKAMAAVGKAPCATCLHAARCAEERIACRDFLYYVRHGEIPDRPAAERKPAAVVFDLIYNGDDDHEDSN